MNTNNFMNTNNLIIIPKVIYKIYLDDTNELPKFPLDNPELQKAHDSWTNL